MRLLFVHLKEAKLKGQSIMMTPSYFFPLFFLLSFVVIAKAEEGLEGPAQLDHYWTERAVEAEKHAMDTYEPNPKKVTEEFNAHVEQFEIGKNNTRRSLSGNGGPCKVTNPIDACWRCDPHWADNRKKLASCVLGFGRKTTGGKNGPFYKVTDASDNDVKNPKAGTLRYAVIQKGPLWITFAHDMVITLQQELIMTSDKTIDARGTNVIISKGAGLTIQFIKNVIITNLHIKDIVPKSGGIIRDSVDHFGQRNKGDGDGISIYGSSNIWIDHVSMENCADGLIDAIQGSTGITISNSYFTHHDHVILLGGSDTFSKDKIMQVTLAFNHFGEGLVQRMPRCRFGFIHVVNNDYTHWLMYAIGGSMNPTIISQGNRFIAPPNAFAKEVTKRDPPGAGKDWEWTSQGDLMMNGAFFVESGKGKGLKTSQTDMIPFKPGTMVAELTKFSGSLECSVGHPC